MSLSCTTLCYMDKTKIQKVIETIDGLISLLQKLIDFLDDCENHPPVTCLYSIIQDFYRLRGYFEGHG